MVSLYTHEEQYSRRAAEGSTTAIELSKWASTTVEYYKSSVLSCEESLKIWNHPKAFPFLIVRILAALIELCLAE